MNQIINYLSMEEKEKVGIKKLRNPKAFTHYSQIFDVYENFEDYNPKC